MQTQAKTAAAIEILIDYFNTSASTLRNENNDNNQFADFMELAARVLESLLPDLRGAFPAPVLTKKTFNNALERTIKILDATPDPRQPVTFADGETATIDVQDIKARKLCVAMISIAKNNNLFA